MAPAPFSTVLRAESLSQHDKAANSSFMSNLLGGRLGIDAFTRLTGQLWYVYRALEDCADQLADDPVAGPFVSPELLRAGELERDLAFLSGPDWRDELEPLPATAEYTERITRVGREWPAGYVAHHYTRYLGDLSGGQIVPSVAEKTWGIARKGDGVRFYDFTAIPNPAAFKRDYRKLLDALPVDEVERRRVVEECGRAYAYNAAVFKELDEQFPLSA